MELKDFQRELLDVLVFFDELCQSLNVKYFLAYGTLLGAVRHHGFIPWDYDADVGMLREDYNKFIHLCSSIKFKKYLLESAELDINFEISFTRLKIKGLYIENIHTGEKYMTYLDIYPFDNVPKDASLGLKLYQFRIKFLRSLKAAKYGERISVNKVKNGLVYLLSKILYTDIGKLSKKLLYAYKKYEKIETGYVTNYSSIYGIIQDKQSKSDLGFCEKIDFEGVKLYAPINYCQVLTNIYGNYEKLPAVEERKSLDLSKFRIIKE